MRQCPCAHAWSVECLFHGGSATFSPALPRGDVRRVGARPGPSRLRMLPRAWKTGCCPLGHRIGGVGVGAANYPSFPAVSRRSRLSLTDLVDQPGRPGPGRRLASVLRSALHPSPLSPSQLRVSSGPRSSSQGMRPGPPNWMHDMTYGLGPSSCVAEVSGPHTGHTALAQRAGLGGTSLARWWASCPAWLRMLPRGRTTGHVPPRPSNWRRWN